MSLRDCQCGKPVRLGALRVTVNRRRGVLNYIAHRDGTPDCEYLKAEKWESVEMKPYARHERDREWHKMIARWDAGVLTPVAPGVTLDAPAKA